MLQGFRFCRIELGVPKYVLEVQNWYFCFISCHVLITSTDSIMISKGFVQKLTNELCTRVAFSQQVNLVYWLWVLNDEIVRACKDAGEGIFDF